MFGEERMDRRGCRAYLHAILTMNAAFPGGYDSERVARFSACFEISWQSVIVSKYSISVDTRNGRNTWLRRKREILRGICHGCWECYTCYTVKYKKLLKILYNELLVSRIFFPLRKFSKRLSWQIISSRLFERIDIEDRG